MEGSRPARYTKAQPVDYYLVIDFEATCEKDARDGYVKDWPNEIIEFPVVVLNAKTLEIEKVTHSFIFLKDDRTSHSIITLSLLRIHDLRRFASS